MCPMFQFSRRSRPPQSTRASPPATPARACAAPVSVLRCAAGIGSRLAPSHDARASRRVVRAGNEAPLTVAEDTPDPLILDAPIRALHRLVHLNALDAHPTSLASAASQSIPTSTINIHASASPSTRAEPPIPLPSSPPPTSPQDRSARASLPRPASPAHEPQGSRPEPATHAQAPASPPRQGVARLPRRSPPRHPPPGDR